MLIDSFVCAFAMYSKIPMPRRNFDAKGMRYLFCFFPLIGVVLGGVLLLWHFANGLMGFGNLFFAVVATCLPVALTGGIHLDGFCDCCDALSSHQPMEKKREILKDPHIGAFGVICCVLLLLLTFGGYAALIPDFKSLLILGVGFVLSRSLSGFSVVTFPPAKAEGLLATFAQKANQKVVRGVLIAYILICSAGMLLIDYMLGAAALLAAFLVFVYYRVMSRRQFGGTTGDIAGYFLTICETAMLLAVLFAQKWAGVA